MKTRLNMFSIFGKADTNYSKDWIEASVINSSLGDEVSTTKCSLYLPYFNIYYQKVGS